MARYISKGAMFSVLLEIDEERLDKMKKASELVDQVMVTLSTYWQTKMLPKHFTPAAHSEYGYAARTVRYLKKKGSRPDLVFSGSMKRDLTASASFNFRKNAIEMRMSARVLNLAPTMPQDSDAPYVKHFKRSTRETIGYPNLKREIKAVTQAEHDALAALAAKELEILFGPSKGAGDAG